MGYFNSLDKKSVKRCSYLAFTQSDIIHMPIFHIPVAGIWETFVEFIVLDYDIKYPIRIRHHLAFKNHVINFKYYETV